MCFNDSLSDSYYDDDSYRRHNHRSCCRSCMGANDRNCMQFEDTDRLPLRICLCYKGLTFDGNNFYATLPAVKKVAIFDRRMRLRAMTDVNAKYEYITYDPNENVFWATIEENNTQIAKLDKNFKLIARVPLSLTNISCQNICSISFNCATNRIVIVYGGNVVEINKNGSFACNVLSNLCNDRICSCLCIAPYHICIINRNGRQYVKVFSTNSCCNYCEKRVPNDFTLQALALAPTCDRCNRRCRRRNSYNCDCDCDRDYDRDYDYDRDDYGCGCRSDRDYDYDDDDYTTTLIGLGTKGCDCNSIIKIKLCNVYVNPCNGVSSNNNGCNQNTCCNTTTTSNPLLITQQITTTSQTSAHEYSGIDNIIDTSNCPYRD